MSVISIPKILEEKLTPKGAEALIALLNNIADRFKDNTMEVAEGRFEKRILETKGDLKEDINRLDIKIDRVKTELMAEISKVKISLVQWMIGLLFAQTAIILAVIKL